MQRFFEIQLEVGAHAGTAGFGSADGHRTASSSAAILGDIENIGWRLENVGYFYMITSETSSDRIFLSGQATAVRALDPPQKQTGGGNILTSIAPAAGTVTLTDSLTYAGVADLAVSGTLTINGNGGSSQLVYFTAGIDHENHGLFGSLTSVAQGTPEGPAEAQMVQAELDVVQLDVTAVIARATVAGIRIALIVDTSQRFRDVVFNIIPNIRVPLPSLRWHKIAEYRNVIDHCSLCNKAVQIVS